MVDVSSGETLLVPHGIMSRIHLDDVLGQRKDSLAFLSSFDNSTKIISRVSVWQGILVFSLG